MSSKPLLCGPYSKIWAGPCGKLSKHGLPFLSHFLVFKIWAHDYFLTSNVNGSNVYCVQTGGVKKQVCLLWFLLMSLLPPGDPESQGGRSLGP